MPEAMFCTVEDVRRVFQDASLSGALAEDNSALVKEQIRSVSGLVEKATKRHWYDPEANTASTRTDEYALPQGGAIAVNGSESPKERIQVVSGDRDGPGPAYARVTLDRKDVQTLAELRVLTAEGTLTDWVASTEYDTGVGLSARGKDAWVRVNNGGVSELNIDVSQLDDEIPSLANAVYAGITYGVPGLEPRARTGTAALVAADLVLDDEFVTAIPDDGQLTDVETKAERFGATGAQKLAPDVVDPSHLEAYR